MDQTLRWSRRAAELVAAAIGGGVVVLGGAAALGKLDSTTTVVHESGATLTPESAAFVRGKHMSVNQIYEDAAPGVVHITATTKADVPADPFFGLPGGTTQQSEIGSGFVIDKNGDIITNDHVVAGASSVRVSFSDNESMDAKLVGEDPSTDVAVLRVSAPSRALRPLVLGNSDGCVSAIRCSRSAIRSGSTAPPPRESSAPSGGRSKLPTRSRRSTARSRPTRRSTTATRVVRS